jgi:hypothetical protein
MLSYILQFHANKFLKTIGLISYKSIQQFSTIEYIMEWVCYVVRTSFKGRGFEQEGEFMFPKYIHFLCASNLARFTMVQQEILTIGCH